MFILQNKNGTGFEIMSAVKKILPPQPRGVDRRSQARADQQDWRVNQRSYEFIGATFDPLTPMQTLARMLSRRMSRLMSLARMMRLSLS